MTTAIGVMESGEAQQSPNDQQDREIGRSNIGHNLQSFSPRKKFFCLPAFASSVGLLDHVCAASRTTIPAPQAPKQKANPIESILDAAVQNQLVAASIEERATQKKKHRPKGKPTPSYRGVSYGSISEAALGILLEELIPGFSVKEGHTFQLPLGQGRTVDFLIENTLVEFHFPRSYSRGRDIGDFKDKKERRDFLRSLNRVGRNRHQRKKLLRATHEKLIQNYIQKRRKQIDMSVYGPHTELIVASTPQEFYRKVICRFVGWEVISEQAFVQRFEQCCQSVVTSSRQAWKRAA